VAAIAKEISAKQRIVMKPINNRSMKLARGKWQIIKLCRLERASMRKLANKIYKKVRGGDGGMINKLHFEIDSKSETYGERISKIGGRLRE